MITSSKVWIFFCWIGVIALTVSLRFNDLAERPCHFDEATGARITSQRLHTTKGYSFNPEHNHGPLLSAAAAPVCRINGENEWRQMTKHSLRLVPAIAGSLLVLVPLLWRRRFGDLPTLAAAALLASSPLLVYYSRMFIHEMLLTLLGLAVVATLCVRPRFSLTIKLGCVGLLVGLMFATKETFAISLIAWTAAGALTALLNSKKIRQHNTAKNRRRLWSDYRGPLAVCLLAAVASSCWFYTNGLSRPGGAWDAVKTFFVYQTTAGHDKPFFYYLEMLVIPRHNAIWWHESLVFILAAIALLRSFLPGTSCPKQENIVRFLAFSTLIHLLIYSAIPYKTPWLMCLPWAQACLLAGLSLRGVRSWRPLGKIAAVVLLAGIIFQQQRLARLASGRLASDHRNPYAYTPTSGDAEEIGIWLDKLARTLPPGSMEPIAVVGREYWPLPWYLREHASIGYWPAPTPAINDCPVVFAMPETAEALSRQLESSHVPNPRSLRHNVPVMMYLRKDLWNQWINTDQP